MRILTGEIFSELVCVARHKFTHTDCSTPKVKLRRHLSQRLRSNTDTTESLIRPFEKPYSVPYLITPVKVRALFFSPNHTHAQKKKNLFPPYFAILAGGWLPLDK